MKPRYKVIWLELTYDRPANDNDSITNRIARYNYNYTSNQTFNKSYIIQWSSRTRNDSSTPLSLICCQTLFYFVNIIHKRTQNATYIKWPYISVLWISSQVCIFTRINLQRYTNTFKYNRSCFKSISFLLHFTAFSAFKLNATRVYLDLEKKKKL